MSTIRVLVVDDDPWTQRMASAVLGHQGHQVDVASDGWEALLRVGQTRPDLVITEVRLPTTDGWSFVETLRSRAETRETPVIFLATFTSDRSPGASYRADLDSFLEKPFRIEQLEARVTAALSRRAAALGLPSPEPRRRTTSRREPIPPDAETRRRAVLTGQLDHFALSSVLIVLELERKSGALLLSRPTGTGRIELREGKVVRAELQAGGRHRGAVAVYELLTWSEGRFEFNPGEVNGEDEIGSSTSYLLMEGARREDERKQQGEGN